MTSTATSDNIGPPREIQNDWLDPAVKHNECVNRTVQVYIIDDTLPTIGTSVLKKASGVGTVQAVKIKERCSTNEPSLQDPLDVDGANNQESDKTASVLFSALNQEKPDHSTLDAGVRDLIDTVTLIDEKEKNEVKVEIKKEWDDELDIIDTSNQFDDENGESPERSRQVERLEDDIVNGGRYGLRRSMRTKKASYSKVIQRILQDENDSSNDEDLKIWSDNSDSDPDYSPLEEEEEQREPDPTNPDRNKNNLKKNATFKYKKVGSKNSYLYKKQKKYVRREVTSYCLYCNKRVQRLVRHFGRLHENEPEVVSLFSLTPRTKERAEALTALEEKGKLLYKPESDKESSIVKVKVQSKLKKIGRICRYCNKRFKNLVKHLKFGHKTEPEVMHLLSLKLGTQDRKTALREILKKCKLCFNRKADLELSKETGEKQENVNMTKPFAKRIRKKNFCLYCEEMCGNFWRHVKHCHENEPEVKEILSFKNGSVERAKAIQTLRNKGNFEYNVSVITKKEGAIINKRTCKTIKDYQNFLPCNYCLGFFTKGYLGKHLEKCSLKGKPKLAGNNHLMGESVLYIPNLCEEATPLDIITSLVNNEATLAEDTVVNSDAEDAIVTSEIHKKRLRRLGACYFCKKLVRKLPRHLITHHSGEAEVKDFMLLKKGNKKRHMIIQALRRKGYFVYNKQIIGLKDDSCALMTARTDLAKPQIRGKYLPCEYCFGLFIREGLMFHTYRCFMNNTPDDEKEKQFKRFSEGKRMREVNESAVALMNCPDDSSPSVMEIRSRLEDSKNKIMNFVANDKLVVKYGGFLMDTKKGNGYITRNIIRLAKLVVTMNLLDKTIVNLNDALKAKHYDTMISVCLAMCTTAAEEKALRLTIKHCCMIKKCDSLIHNDKDRMSDVNNFLAILKEQWFESLIDKKALDNKEGYGEIIDSEKPTSSILGEHTVINVSKEDIDNIHLSSLCYRRKGVCLYCQKAIYKLRRHWETKHPNEPDIKKLCNLKKGSFNRSVLIRALRNKGSFRYNMNVLKCGKGFLIISRGEAQDNNYSRYLPCEYCLGFVKCGLIKHHTSRCSLRPQQEISGDCSYRPTYFARLLLHNHKPKSQTLQKILDYLKNDRIKSVVVKDELICKYGQLYIDQNCSKPEITVFKYTSLRLRALGALVVECQKLNQQMKSLPLQECLQLKFFNDLLSAATILSFRKPVEKDGKIYFRFLGFLLQTCCRIIRNETILNNVGLRKDEDTTINGFLIHFQSKWVYPSTDKVGLDVDFIQTKKQKRPKWSAEELSAVSSFFSSYIKRRELPGKSEINDCINNNEILKRRGWVAVKSKLHSMLPQVLANSDLQSSDNWEHKEHMNLCESPQLKSKSSGVHEVRPNPLENISANNVYCNDDSQEEERTYLHIGSFNLPQYTSTTEGNNCNDACLDVSQLQELMDMSLTNDDVNSSSSIDFVENLLSNNSSHHRIKKTDDQTRMHQTNRLKRKKRSNKRGRYQEWTSEENKSLLLFFNDHIKREKVPSKVECEDCIDEQESLKNRHWVSVRSKVYNIITSSKKDKTQKINKQSNNEMCDQTVMRGQTDLFQVVTGQRSDSNVSGDNVGMHCTSGDQTPAQNNKRKAVKHPWSFEENEVIYSFFEKHIADEIVPGKTDSEACIKQNPCLSARSWVTVKSKVHNIITTKRRRTH